MPPAPPDPPPPPESRPVAPQERFEALDAIRGVALLGVALANLVFAFRISPTAWYVAGGDALSPGVDGLAEAFVRTLVQGKALALFSMLFGVGLAIQHDRFAARGAHGLLARRLLVLLAFGLVHRFGIWNGDILVDYALAGLVLVPFAGAPPAILARVALAAMTLYGVGPLLPVFPDWPTDTTLARELAAANAIYPTAGFLAIRAYAAHEWRVFLPVWISLFPSTVVLMALGMLAWRSGALAQADRHRPRVLLLGAAALVAGALLTALQSRDPTGMTTALALMAASSFAAPVLAVGYGAAMLLALEAPRGRRVLAYFVAPGRMAFTNYLAQSVVFGFVFFGYGLGLMNRVGSAATLAFGLACFALQAVASAWWLARFRFGPMEWAWRSLTYGRAQPMRR